MFFYIKNISSSHQQAPCPLAGCHRQRNSPFALDFSFDPVSRHWSCPSWRRTCLQLRGRVPCRPPSYSAHRAWAPRPQAGDAAWEKCCGAQTSVRARSARFPAAGSVGLDSCVTKLVLSRGLRGLMGKPAPGIEALKLKADGTQTGSEKGEC